MATIFSTNKINKHIKIGRAGIVVVEKNVLISDENTAMFDGFDFATIANNGTIMSGGGDAYSIFTGGSGATVINAASGTITCSTGEGVFMLGDRSTVVNMGRIYASLAAVQADIVTNSGSILAGDLGVRAYESIDNTGTIDAIRSAGVGVELSSQESGRSPRIANQGLIRGDTAVSAYGGRGEDLVLTNSGTLEGTVKVDLFDQCLVRNTGTIAGDLHLGLLITNIPTGKIMSTLLNSGTIHGDVVCGSLGDAVRNTGLIDGDVMLSGSDPNFDPEDEPEPSADRFDGRRGRVTGSITGGAANDTILAGDDGETIAGGGGHDHLTGGRGADTFVVSSFAATDLSRINDFNVADDLIRLDHHVFATLTPHLAPAFSIGTKASGASDHLFYNPVSGTLFYDADGDGSAHASAIARLATGLTMTASNFSVV